MNNRLVIKIIIINKINNIIDVKVLGFVIFCTTSNNNKEIFDR